MELINYLIIDINLLQKEKSIKYIFYLYFNANK